MDLPAIQAALSELMQSAGNTADATVTIQANSVFCYFRPDGWGQDNPTILEHGSTAQDAVEAVRIKWEAMRAHVVETKTKKLALAIICITHEMGCCTDASLRTEFGADDVKRFSGDALMLANKMAENGPFEILELQGANAA